MRETAFSSGNILLPRSGIDLTKWAVVACDQFTSEPQYWKETERIVGDAPSALHLILPEVYLSEKDIDVRLGKLEEQMAEYEDRGYFEEYKNAMIYVERTDSSGKMRAGLVGKLDLEQYDYRRGSRSQVRATEATVTERIPPRMRVRKQASVELPHSMILIDDPQKTVIEPFQDKKDSMTKLYDFALMQGGGSIRGYLLGQEEITQVENALSDLLEQKAQQQIGEEQSCRNGDIREYSQQQSERKESSCGRRSEKTCAQQDVREETMLYAVGDGNHSLATAKEYYEYLKAVHPQKDLSDHPARYALVELVNLHSPALEFKAIERIVTETDVVHLMREMTTKLGLSAAGEGQKVKVIHGEMEEDLVIRRPDSNLAVGSIQNFLDDYLKRNPGRIDYIHGRDSARQLAQQANSLAILLPDMRKEELFPSVLKDGALPRKTFSMGNAQDKRYYLEGRRIR